MGHNTLSKVVKTLCETAGVGGNKTNHSLRATCATRLYNNSVDEQLIMERTGHRSTKGVRAYKRTSDTLLRNTSVIIDGKSISNQVNSTITGKTDINFHIVDCNVTIHNA